MFVFAPSYSSSAHSLGSLYQPEAYYPQPSTSPRDRYLAALAQARSAEAEYLAALVNEQALKRQRQEELEQRQRALRVEAARKALLLDALFSHDATTTSSPYTDPFAYARQPVNPLDADIAAIRRGLELGHASAQRRRQEELAKQERFVALVRQKQEEERERARARSIIRQLHLSKQREQLQAKVDHPLEDVLHLLFGEPPARPEPVAKPEATCSRAASHSQASKGGNGEVERLLKFAESLRPRAPEEHKEKETQQTRCCQAQLQKKPSDVPDTQQPKAPAEAPSTCESNSSDGPFKRMFESRLRNERDPKTLDSLQRIHTSMFGSAAKLERKERVEKRNSSAVEVPAPAPAATASATSATTPTTGLSLKEHFEARLQKDPGVEVHDTIQAILASLFTPRHAPTQSQSQAAKDVKQAPVSTSAPTDRKGKGKQVSFDFQQPTTAPTFKDVLDSVNTIRNIEAAFKLLSTDFSFPTHLDFSPPTSPTASDADLLSTTTTTSSDSELAYTSTNAPVRYYEQALSALLTQLDAVESWGNEEVRKQRKDLVGRVEGALEEVEREVQVRLVQYRARSGVVASHEETVKKEESTAVEVAVESPAPEGENKDSSPAVEVNNVSEQHSSDSEDLVMAVGADATPTSASPEENNTLADSQATITPNENVSVEIDTIPVAASDESHDSQESAAPSVEVPVVIESTENEADISAVHASYPPSVETFETATVPESTTQAVSPAAQAEVAIEQLDAITTSEPEQSAPSSPQTATEESESGPVDTFLLPFESPVLSKRPAATNDDDEMVVIDKEHGEGSDGDNWSEVEA